MRKSSPRSLPSLSLRIDLNTGGRIGPGKIQLLENIRSCGSISAAGRAMDVSYKRAWDLVDEINRICGRAAVERKVGGKHGGGRYPHAVWPFSRRALSENRALGGERGPQGASCIAGGHRCSTSVVPQFDWLPMPPDLHCRDHQYRRRPSVTRLAPFAAVASMMAGINFEEAAKRTP
jgi:molybdenum-dependent DNA-binding transcriptional regulator ModE